MRPEGRESPAPDACDLQARCLTRRLGVRTLVRSEPRLVNPGPRSALRIEQAHVRFDSMSEITQLLQASSRGVAHASEELLPMVYEDLRRQAAMQMARESAGQTLQPTALLHEAWLRIIGGGGRQWQNRAHFFGAAAEAMRRILIENARRKSRLKRGGGLVRVNCDEIELAATTPDERILLIDEAIERLAGLDPEKAKVVVMKFFGGRTNQEVAESLCVTERTVERHWAHARAWLFHHIRTHG